MDTWVCERCDHVHTEAASECQACGHETLQSATVSDVEDSGHEAAISEYQNGMSEDDTADYSPDPVAGLLLQPAGFEQASGTHLSKEEIAKAQPDRTWQWRVLLAGVILTLILSLWVLLLILGL